MQMNFALGGARAESEGSGEEAAQGNGKHSSDVFIVHAELTHPAANVPIFASLQALKARFPTTRIASHRVGRPSRSWMTVVPPVALSRHSSTVRIRLSASERTPKPTGPMTTPTLGDAGRSSTILHRFVVGS
jgi:hypothetical protein